MAEKIISGNTLRFDKLKPFEGLRLSGRVLKILGPAWGYIDRLFDADEKSRDAGALLMMGAIIKDMDVGEVVGLLKELCALCQIKRSGGYEPLEPEFHLKSETEIIQVALWVLEIQFRDFFGAAKGSKLGAAILASTMPSSDDMRLTS